MSFNWPIMPMPQRLLRKPRGILCWVLAHSINIRLILSLVRNALQSAQVEPGHRWWFSRSKSKSKFLRVEFGFGAILTYVQPGQVVIAPDDDCRWSKKSSIPALLASLRRSEQLLISAMGYACLVLYRGRYTVTDFDQSSINICLLCLAVSRRYYR